MDDDASMSDRRHEFPAEVLALPGRRMMQSMSGLASIIRTTQENIADLRRWLSRTDDFDVFLTVWNETDRTALDEHLDGTVRRFFNFAASAHSRVEYYQGVRKRGHMTGELEEEYEARLFEFKRDPVHLWVIGGRRYMIHYNLPIATGRVQMERPDLTAGFDIRSSVVIETAELVAAKREFPGAARAWMRERDHIDLREILPGYATTLAGFDDWFGPAFAAYHLEACEEYLDARERATREWWQAKKDGSAAADRRE